MLSVVVATALGLRAIGPRLAAAPPIPEAAFSQLHLPVELETALPPWVLTVPASLATVLLALHGVRRRGAGTMALLAFLCVAYYLPKEQAIARGWVAEHVYEFVMGGLRLGGVPLVVPLGYVFTHTLSWTLAERITDRMPGCRDRLFPVAVVWLLVTASVAYVMETTGVAAGWWLWTENDGPWRSQPVGHRMFTNSGTIHPVIPYVPIYGWPIFALPVVAAVLVLAHGPLARARLRPLLWLAGTAVYFLVSPWLALVALAVASVTSGLGVDPPRRALPAASRFDRLVARAPEVAVAAMLTTSAVVLLGHAADPTMLAAWVPLLALLAVADAGRGARTVTWLLFAALAAARLAGALCLHHAALFAATLALLPSARSLWTRVAAWLAEPPALEVPPAGAPPPSAPDASPGERRVGGRRFR